MKINIKIDPRLNKYMNIRDARASVGWYEDTRYDDNTKVGVVAEIQEYGAGKIPPRPFMRPARMKNEEKWQRIAKQEIKRCLDNKQPLSQAFGKVAMVAQGDIVQAITEVWSPPLKKSTVYARLHRKSDKKTIGALDKPLIDTGTMIGTIGVKVEDV